MSTRIFQQVRADSGTGVKNVQRIRRGRAVFYRVKLTARGTRNFHVGYRTTLAAATRLADRARRVLLVAVLLIGVRPVNAQSLKLPTTIFVAAATFDTTTTVLALQQPDRYGETAPFVMGPVSAGLVLAGTTVLTVWSARKLRDGGHPTLAKSVLWIGAGMRGTYAVLNVRTLQGH